MSDKKSRISIRKITMMAMLFTLAMVLSLLENIVTLDAILPGIKLGLSNIVTMYCLFSLGIKEAYILTLLKSTFVFITRNPTSALLSFSGGVLSITAMVIVMKIFRKQNPSYAVISVVGAVVHNMSQFTVYFLMYGIKSVVAITTSFLILLIIGIIMGIITATVLRAAMPAVEKLNLNKKQK